MQREYKTTKQGDRQKAIYLSSNIRTFKSTWESTGLLEKLIDLRQQGTTIEASTKAERNTMT